MKNQLFALLGSTALILCGCKDDNQKDGVISQQYLHKYGYFVSEEEWQTHNYPGQVVTNLENGVTITTSIENGIKHGPTSHTFPHSQTIEHYYLFNRGSKIKEISYDALGFPIKEWIQLSPTRYSMTTWYKAGSPMYV